MAGLKIYRNRIGAGKRVADLIMGVSLNFNTFINVNEAKVLELIAIFKKPLASVTKANVLAEFPDMEDDEALEAMKHLKVIAKLITEVKPIRDDLPANDLGV